MIFEFSGFHCKSRCEIDILGKVVIATQLDLEDLPGTSITNAAEVIATEICDRYNIKYNELIFIEHYKENGINEESYSIVKFDIKENGFYNPQWKRTNIENIANIIKTKSGCNDLENFIINNRKRMELDYNTRKSFLKAICRHEHFKVTDKDNKKYCYACGESI